jgi:hypothetical protein
VRVLLASTRGAGHYHPLVPFIEMRALPPVDDALVALAP